MANPKQRLTQQQQGFLIQFCRWAATLPPVDFIYIQPILENIQSAHTPMETPNEKDDTTDLLQSP